MLRANKVYLRRLEETDLPTTLKWINDPEIMVVMGVRGPRSSQEQREWYDKIASSSTNIVFAICLITDDRYIGNVSLFAIDPFDRNAGITVFIGEEKDRGHGYGYEAVELVIEYGFAYLNLNKIHCRSNVDKLPALRIYERLGFAREGLLRQHSFQYGEYVDKVVLGILKDEYNQQKDRDKNGGR